MSTTHTTAAAAATNNPEKRHRSIFDLPPHLFNSARLLQSPSSLIDPPIKTLNSQTLANNNKDDDEQEEHKSSKLLMQNWTCNTCKIEFDSLIDQRAHFKSDIHRFNIKLSIAGKGTVKEEDFDESTSESLFKDNDISSISGSEDEDDKISGLRSAINGGLVEGSKKKLFIQLQTGEIVSIWKCLLMDESENISFENDNSAFKDGGGMSSYTETEVIEKLNNLVHEPRDNTRFRIVLLARGGHFAGCVFDGNSVVAHKTFHRYVIRARAGKKQSSKDASGKIAHSAGASIRRYNELALKKEIQELFAAWKCYFDASSCIFIHAPSSNRQLLFDGEKPYFNYPHHGVRHVPLTVRRPTLKEAKRLYSLLTQVSDEAEEELLPITKEESKKSTSNTADGCPESRTEDARDIVDGQESTTDSSTVQKLENLSISSEGESERKPTPLHDAARSNNAEQVLELLEQGLDPCVKDERGRTPYMLATEKEVRNTFRRYMASNLDKWDWSAAKVPSALTKEMEESQNTKQAEKDAKRKARAKELKKLRKAKEKKAQAEAAQAQKVAPTSGSPGATSNPVLKLLSQFNGGPSMSKEEELRKAQAEEREKRAAAAERRLAAAAALKASGANVVPNSSSANNSMTSGINCSCCQASLAGKVPFHRYNYKYCSTSCMHVHREMIEDG